MYFDTEAEKIAYAKGVELSWEIKIGGNASEDHKNPYDPTTRWDEYIAFERGKDSWE